MSEADGKITSVEQELFMKVFGSYMMYNVAKLEKKEGYEECLKIPPELVEWMDTLDKMYKFTEGQKDFAVGGIMVLMAFSKLLKERLSKTQTGSETQTLQST